ncbi:MAG: FAD-binding protein, partial [Candidatus Mcinerneyibacterium aminivorans]
KCLQFNIDITKDMIPVVPAAHYNCGGIKAKVNGTTDIDNLFAVGETACTGFHGANRLASNSLLEGAVMALKASNIIKNSNFNQETIPELDYWESPVTLKHENVIINNNWDELRRTMWNFVGIVRSDRRLKYALKRVNLIEEEIKEFYYENPVSTNLLEMRNLIINAKIIIYSALWRKESRGIHYTIDYPESKKEYRTKYSSFKKGDL